MEKSIVLMPGIAFLIKPRRPGRSEHWKQTSTFHRPADCLYRHNRFSKRST
jgi:hypothetical protein